MQIEARRLLKLSDKRTERGHRQWIDSLDTTTATNPHTSCPPVMSRLLMIVDPRLNDMNTLTSDRRRGSVLVTSARPIALRVRPTFSAHTIAAGNRPEVA